MERKEINARLEAVREQLAALSVEVSEISNAAPYKLGSRVSYVSDRIKQAIEDVNACLEFPERWRVEEQAETVPYGTRRGRSGSVSPRATGWPATNSR